MNKFRYVTRHLGGEPILINIEQVVCIDERNQTIWLSNGQSLILVYNDVWQLADDLKNLEVGDKL